MTGESQNGPVLFCFDGSDGSREAMRAAAGGVFWSNEDRALRMRRQSMGDTAKQSATENTPASLAAYDHPCRELVGDLQNGLGHAFEGLFDHR